MLLEINFPEEATVCLHESVDLVRDLALVKNVATFFTDQPQGFREGWIFENIALRRSATLAVERVRFKKRAGQSLVKPRAKRQVIRDQLCDRKPFFGITNRGCKIIAQLQFPEFLVELCPCVHGSRHA